jgi:hypothetical protein
MGALSLGCAEAMLQPSRLGLAVALGYAAFWGARMSVQLFVYDRRLWPGRRFETAVPAALCLLWANLAGVYAALAVAHWAEAPSQ